MDLLIEILDKIDIEGENFKEWLSINGEEKHHSKYLGLFAKYINPNINGRVESAIDSILIDPDLINSIKLNPSNVSYHVNKEDEKLLLSPIINLEIKDEQENEFNLNFAKYVIQSLSEITINLMDNIKSPLDSLDLLLTVTPSVTKEGKIVYEKDKLFEFNSFLDETKEIISLLNNLPISNDFEKTFISFYSALNYVEDKIKFTNKFKTLIKEASNLNYIIKDSEEIYNILSPVSKGFKRISDKASKDPNSLRISYDNKLNDFIDEILKYKNTKELTSKKIAILSGQELTDDEIYLEFETPSLLNKSLIKDAYGPLVGLNIHGKKNSRDHELIIDFYFGKDNSKLIKKSFENLNKASNYISQLPKINVDHRFSINTSKVYKVLGLNK